ncbi:disease resistance protein RPV1-like [Argentina anserina]|uniref:disease resistance protein RPV1-like n=1 Tax=Argentina anserina TaxID=57926 RepID=UPI0021768735|nr:disease resistance protein RPV1-like [Potentilla anserina]
MAASSSSSSSGETGGSLKYDVFINFRGADTRRSFVCHLYEALKQKALDIFIDSQELGKGDELSEILTAIQDSRLSIIVFSKHYASSTWCLKELVQILECVNTQKHKVVPIFYETDPSDIRKLKGSFEKAFAKHERDSNIDKEELESWKSNLTRATNLSGYDSRNYQDDAKLIKDIVEDIFEKLTQNSASETVDLVGMDSHISGMNLLLCPGVNDFRIVGIWGMGGIGKSTIARAIYENIARQFQHCCFLENVREGFLKNGEIYMKEELLCRILKEGKVHPMHFNMTMERLGKKKVLLVLDDVDNINQIETLLGNKPSFGGESRVIITTRNKHLLGGYAVYEPRSLSDDRALELFRQYAFRAKEPTGEYDHLSSCVIRYAHGLPLALKVLGASLDGKSVREWEDELQKIKKIQHTGIHGVLRISFDGLDNSQKNIFLDIACFFKGMNKDHVTKFLEYCGFFPHSGLRVLVDRALISISSDDTLEMHDLLQEMGREIGTLSRICSYEDVDRVLTQNTATEEIEGMTLDLSSSNELHLNAEAFLSMRKLRLLQIHDHNNHIDLDGDFFERCLHSDCKQHVNNGELKFLSHELRVLIWHGCPLKSLPFNYEPKNLLYLDMSTSHIEQLWEGTKPMENVRCMNLSHSQCFAKTPDFSKAKNLEKLNLKDCISLSEVHPSLSALKNLVHLNLNGCIELKRLARSIHMESLQILNLSGCSNLEKFPEISGVMKELWDLRLDGTAIEKLPSSINKLTGLFFLALTGCIRLRSLPRIIQMKSLRLLDLSGCSHLEDFPEISEDMTELSALYLDETAIKELPSSIEFLHGLATLSMTNCRSLICLPDKICNLSYLQELSLAGCTKLSNLPENLGNIAFLRALDIKGSGIQQLPFSILRLSRLDPSLSCNGCKQMMAPFSSWPPLIKSECRNSVVVHLDLSDCNLLELSDCISHISTLVSLKLSRNNMESIPATMKMLQRLTDLDLEGCNRLKSIPELPSSICYIDAHNCTALEIVSPVNLQNEDTFCLTFSNCLRLWRQNPFIEIVETHFQQQDARLKHLFGGMHLPKSQIAHWFNSLRKGLLVTLPGSEIPDWFNHQCMGSSVTVRLPPNWSFDKLMGIAICAVSNKCAHNIVSLQSSLCFCTFKGNHGQRSFKFPFLHERFRTDRFLDSDHMFLRYKTGPIPVDWYSDDRYYTEVRFRIMLDKEGSRNDFKTLKACSYIISCGVRFFDVNHEELEYLGTPSPGLIPTTAEPDPQMKISDY